MGRSYWVTPLEPFHIADAAAYASATALTDVSPLPNISIPANLMGIGTEIEITGAGQFSTTGTPTLLLGVYLNGIAGAALAASSAITTGSNAAAWPWQVFYRGVIRTPGATGSIQGQGRLYLGTSLTAFTVRPIPETQAARTVTIDTTVARSVTIGAQWGTNSASNTLTCTDISVKVVN